MKKSVSNEKLKKREKRFRVGRRRTVYLDKEAAWNFIEESLTQEKDNELYAGFYITYPILKKILNERAKARRPITACKKEKMMQ